MRQFHSETLRQAAMLTLASFASLALYGLVVQAQQQGPAPAQSTFSQRSGDLISQLNLTAEQLEKIRAIGAEQKEERQTLGRRIRQAERALDDAIYVDNADETVVAARAKDVAEARADMVRLQAIRELRIRRILSPDQLTTFLELRRQQREAQQQRRFELRTKPNAGDQHPGATNNFSPRRSDRVFGRQTVNQRP